MSMLLRALAVTALCLTALSAPAAGAGTFDGDTYQIDPIAFTVKIPPGYTFARGTAAMTLSYDRTGAVEGTAGRRTQTIRTETNECSLQAAANETLLKIDIAAGALPLSVDPAEKPRQAGHVVSLEFLAAGSGTRYVVDLKYFDSMKRKETLREAAGKGLAKKVAARYEGLVLPLESLESGGELQAVRPQGGEPVELYCRAGSLDEAR